MSRSRILSSIVAASLGITLLGACSAESLTERAVEAGLEQAAEGGQDIDLDFNNDGSGGFSISTEDGEFSIDLDAEAGQITFDTEDGDGVINFDEEDGTVTVTTDDGGASFATNVEVPEEWPSVIGVPATQPPGTERYNVVEIGGAILGITGDFEFANGDPFGAEVVARLQADGWDGEPAPSSDGGLGAFLKKDGATIQIIADPNYAQIIYTLPFG